jgi:hypothetical protein
MLMGCGLKVGKVAAVRLSPEPFAVGCFFQVAVVDNSLTLGRPFNPGAPSVRLADPGVARVAENGELPPSLAPNAGIEGKVWLFAVAPGQTTIEMEADFDDGSHRRATATVRVRAIDALDISPTCNQAVDLPLLTPVGATYAFDAAPQGGGQTLAGYCPGAILGDGVTCAPAILRIVTDLTTNVAHCQWPAPSSGGSVTLTSPLLASFSDQVSTYGPADVTDVAAGVSSGARQIGAPGHGGGSFLGHVLVGGKRPCRSLGLQVATLTPAVCAGPAGEAAWLSTPSGIDDEQTVAYSSLAEGRCRLALGAAGAGTNPTTVELPIRVASDVTAAHAIDIYQPCATEGALTCAPAFQSVLICHGGGWNSYADCPAGQACEFFEPGSNGCTASTGCARCR